MSKMFAKRFGSPKMDSKGSSSIEAVMSPPATHERLRKNSADGQKLKNRMSTAIRKSFSPMSPKSPSATSIPTLSPNQFSSRSSATKNRKSVAIKEEEGPKKRDRRRSSFSGTNPAPTVPSFDPSKFRRPSLPSVNLSFRKSSYTKNAALAPPGGSLHPPPVPEMTRSSSGQSTKSNRDKPHPVIPPSSFGPNTFEPLLEGLGIGMQAPQLKLTSKPATPPPSLSLKAPSPRLSTTSTIPVPVITYASSHRSTYSRSPAGSPKIPRVSPRSSPRSSPRTNQYATPPDSPTAGMSRTSSAGRSTGRVPRIVPPTSSSMPRPISAMTLEIKSVKREREPKGEAPPVPLKSPNRQSMYKNHSATNLSPPAPNGNGWRESGHAGRSKSVDSLHPIMAKGQSHTRSGSGSASRSNSHNSTSSRPISRSSSSQDLVGQTRPLSVMKPLPPPIPSGVKIEYVLRPTVTMGTQTPNWDDVKARSASVSSTGWTRRSSVAKQPWTRTPEQAYEPFPRNLASIAPPQPVVAEVDTRRISRHSVDSRRMSRASRNSPGSEYPPTPMISSFPQQQLFSHIGYKTNHANGSQASSIYGTETESDGEDRQRGHGHPYETSQGYEEETEHEGDGYDDSEGHSLPSFEIEEPGYYEPVQPIPEVQPPLPSFTPAFHTPFDPAFKTIKKKQARDSLHFNRSKSRSPRPQTPPSDHDHDRDSTPEIEQEKTPSIPFSRSLAPSQSLTVPTTLDFIPSDTAIARPRLVRRRSSQPNTGTPQDEEHLALSRAEKSRSYFLVQALNKAPPKKNHDFTEDEESDDGSDHGSLFL